MKRSPLYLLIPVLTGCSAGMNVADSDVTANFNEQTKTLSISHKGNPVAAAAYVKATLDDGSEIDSRNYPDVKLSKQSISDGYGKGTRYTYTYSGASPVIEQNIYVYPGKDYFLVDAALTGDNNAASRISPIVSDAPFGLPFAKAGSYTQLTLPTT